MCGTDNIILNSNRVGLWSISGYGSFIGLRDARWDGV